MNAAKYLKVRGISVDWLESACDDLADGDAEESDEILMILAEMIEAGVPLPPKAAGWASGILRRLADGEDARDFVGTKPGRGAPRSDIAAEKHRQAVACVELLKMAGIRPTTAAQLVAIATPLDLREIWDLPKEEPAGKWNSVPYFAELGFGKDGCGVLRRLINVRPADPNLHTCWGKFIEFCAVNRIS